MQAWTPIVYGTEVGKYPKPLSDFSTSLGSLVRPCLKIIRKKAEM